jgi:hypothetical protein
LKRILCAAAFASIAACMNDFSKFEGAAPNEADAASGTDATSSGGGGTDAARPVDAGGDAPACDVSRCVSNNATCKAGCDQTLTSCEAGCGSSMPCKRTCRDQRDACAAGCRTVCTQCAGTCVANCS